MNGNVAAADLYTYLGVQIARVIYPDLAAAAAEFAASHFTFSIALPVGGYRSEEVQTDMHAHLWPDPKYHLSKSPPSPSLAPVGQSRHGFAKAVDVISTAPRATRDAIMARHHFRLWTASDNNHYEWGNALSAAFINIRRRDMDMITRRLVRRNGTPGVYYAVNNVLSPVISEQHLADIQADLLGLQAAGDPFLMQAGDSATITAVAVVSDLRTAGILPTTESDLAAIDFDPSQDDIDRITAGSIDAGPKPIVDDFSDLGIPLAISRLDDDTLAAYGLKRF